MFNLIQGYCGVGFSVCTGVPIGTPVFSMGPATSAGRSDVDATCTEDWILSPCATDQQSTSIMQSDGKTACVSKICGFFFDSVAAGKANIPVYSKLVPITEIGTFVNLRSRCRLPQTVRSSRLHRYFWCWYNLLRRILPLLHPTTLHCFFRLK